MLFRSLLARDSDGFIPDPVPTISSIENSMDQEKISPHIGKWEEDFEEESFYFDYISSPEELAEWEVTA